MTFDTEAMTDIERDQAETCCVQEYDGDCCALFDLIADLRADLDVARETNRRLNRRAQLAESAAQENVEACIRKGSSLGRMLANWAASRQRRRGNRWKRTARRMAAEARFYRAMLAYSVVHGEDDDEATANASLFVDHVTQQLSYLQDGAFGGEARR